MTKVLLVIVIALGVGVLSYGASYMRSGDHRVQESAEHLDDLVATTRARDAQLAREAEGKQPAGDRDPYRRPGDDHDASA